MTECILAEKWLPVPCYEGCYEVSDQGRVRSLDRVLIRKNGKHLTCKGKMLSFRPDNNGYHRILLANREERVHRLVATAFLSNPLGLPFVNHKDGNKANNRVGNLEWCTPKENQNHAIRTGLLNPRQNGNSKLDIHSVKNIRVLSKSGAKSKEIAAKYGVSLTTVNDILSGRSWYWQEESSE